MHIIKPCPACGIKLRFPIDTGTVKVRCRCGYSFLANPDDPRLYGDATFDLALNKMPKKTLTIDSIKKLIIEKMYSYWYTIGNFKLLPTKDKIRVIVIILAIVLLSLVILYYLFFSHSQPPENGIVI